MRKEISFVSGLKTNERESFMGKDVFKKGIAKVTLLLMGVMLLAPLSKTFAQDSPSGLTTVGNPISINDVTATGVPSGWVNSEPSVTLTINKLNPLAPFEKIQYQINNGSWTDYSAPITNFAEGRTSVNYRSTNAIGIAGPTNTFEVDYDKTAPVTTASGVPSGWVNQEPQVTLSATDLNAGVAKTQYQINNGNWTDYTGPISSFAEGKNSVAYRSIDRAGNIEQAKTFEVNYDKTAPVTTSSSIPKSWTNKNVTFTLSATDNESGTAKTEYEINNGAWTAYTHSITISKEGDNTVGYRSIDQAGNSEKTHIVHIKIDKTRPTLKVTLNKTVINQVNNKMVPIKATTVATDKLSGIASIQLVSIVSNQPTSKTDIQGAKYGTNDTSFEVRAEMTSKHRSRVYTVTYEATDKAGNKTLTSKTILVK